MVEWCKARARAQRWVEEVRLLDEEMRRLLASTENAEDVWEARRLTDGPLLDLGEKMARWASDNAWADGLRAYASKQAHIRRVQKALWGARLLPIRMAAATFLSSHTEGGMCSAPVEGLLESVAAMSLDAGD